MEAKINSMADILIHAWEMPKDCLECPFFKINVANAGNGASLVCRAQGERFTKVDHEWLGHKRSANCPLEEVPKDGDKFEK